MVGTSGLQKRQTMVQKEGRQDAGVLCKSVGGAGRGKEGGEGEKGDGGGASNKSVELNFRAVCFRLAPPKPSSLPSFPRPFLPFFLTFPFAVRFAFCFP